MKAIIVNCFDTYEERVDLAHEFFVEQGYDVTVIHSNFRHFKKIHRDDLKDDYVFINSKPYYKNLSFARLFSHYWFAKDAFKIVEKIKPDLLYVLVPPNYLAKFGGKYKQKHEEVKLILDLMDLWPETMPIGKLKMFPPFTFWGAIRNNSFRYANYIITECVLFKDILSESLKNIRTETIYLAKRDLNIVNNLQLSEVDFHLAYLGSINNIIDIPKIKEIIEVLSSIRPVTLHIIGEGEKRVELIREAESVGASVIFYGSIYNSQEKQDIFDKCHFGLNIMKSSVCVGLTMKSIDYFQHGIPILSNIPADTYDFIEKYGVGINVPRIIDKDVLSKQVLSYLIQNRDRSFISKKFFESFFSVRTFKNRLSLVYYKL